MRHDEPPKLSTDFLRYRNAYTINERVLRETLETLENLIRYKYIESDFKRYEVNAFLKKARKDLEVAKCEMMQTDLTAITKSLNGKGDNS